MRSKTRAIPMGYTGTIDDIIYYQRGANGRLYARKKPSAAIHSGNNIFSAAQRGIYAFNPSQGYRQNLADYMIGYNQLKATEDKPAQCWNNLYNKLMFAMQRTMGIPLAQITRQMITDLGLPCSSVKAAVEAGLLPWVRGYERFDRSL